MDLLHKQNMLEDYKRKIDSISKELIKKILEKMDEEDFALMQHPNQIIQQLVFLKKIQNYHLKIMKVSQPTS